MSAVEILRPSRRRTAYRAFLGTVVMVFGVGATTSGAWPIGVPGALIGVFVWVMTLLILFRPRAYELHLDDHGFRVHDLFGRPVHDVAWTALARLHPTMINGSVPVVGFVCSPRPPKRGRLRWVRGTAEDDGCMPDHYGMREDELINLMLGRQARSDQRPPD